MYTHNPQHLLAIYNEHLLTTEPGSEFSLPNMDKNMQSMEINIFSLCYSIFHSFLTKLNSWSSLH